MQISQCNPVCMQTTTIAIAEFFFFCYFILSVVIIEEPYANEPPAAGSSSSRVCKTTLPNDMQMRDAAVVAGFSISARLCRFTTATGDGDDADYKPTDNR